MLDRSEKVNILFPDINYQNFTESLNSIKKRALLKPFNHIAFDFIVEFSNKILLDKSLRKYPEIVAMAYWMRKHNLLLLQERYNFLSNEGFFAPRGVILHFTASNVDTLFMYPLVISILVGNTNIVKVSRKSSGRLDIIIDLLVKISKNKKYEEIFKRLLILSYEPDDTLSLLLSSSCHLRIIWGSDATVKNIRKIPIPAIANEIVFPEKFSIAFLSSESINKLNNQELSDLIKRFYNDVYYFQQMACSSPKVIFWIGSKDNTISARSRFWKAFYSYISEYGFSQKDLQDSLCLERLNTVCIYAALDKISESKFIPEDLISRFNIKSLDDDVRKLHKGFGLFLESEYNCLSDLISIFSERDQTISTFGFSREELTSFLHKIPGRTIDRIVPVGEALSFSSFWDGYDLLYSLLRHVQVGEIA